MIPRDLTYLKVAVRLSSIICVSPSFLIGRAGGIRTINKDEDARTEDFTSHLTFTQVPEYREFQSPTTTLRYNLVSVKSERI